MKLLVYRVIKRLRDIQHWIVAKFTFGLLWLAAKLPAATSLILLEKSARRFGPLHPRHKVALANLELAFPEMELSGREAIARDMWGNMGRLLGEYVFLDQIFDFDPERPGSGRVTVDGVEIFERILERKGRPAIFFTAHMGNFELLPVAAATYGLNVTALFKAPHNPYLAERLLGARHTAMGHLVPSRAGASLALARALEDGGHVGMLIDQHFIRGIPTEFFGHVCSTSPLIGKLARNYDCDIYPARCVRLPGGRFHLTLFDAIEPPRQADGRIDANALTRQATSIVEDWIRKDPGQWMWFHKRWKKTGGRRMRHNHLQS